MTNFYKKLTGSEVQGDGGVVVQPAGTLVIDSNTNTLRLHDGSTPGGNQISGNYGDSNVATFLGSGTFSSNISTTGNLIVGGDIEGLGNTVVVTADTKDWTFYSNGSVLLPGGVNQLMSGYPGPGYMSDVATLVSTQPYIATLDGSKYIGIDGTNALVGLGSQVWAFGSGGRLSLGQTFGAIYADQTTGVITIGDSVGPNGEALAPSTVINIGGSDNAFVISRYAVPQGVTWQFMANGATSFPDHGDVTMTGNLTVGNLFVNGNSTIINTQSYTVEDNVLQIAAGNPADSLDIGFVGHRTVNSVLQHTGLVRNASLGQWALFSNVITQPGTTVDFTNAIYDNIRVGNLVLSGITNPADTSGYIINVKGIVGTTASSGANISGFSYINSGAFRSDNYQFANGVNILSTVSAASGTYSNSNVTAYLTNTTVPFANSVSVTALTNNQNYFLAFGNVASGNTILHSGGSLTWNPSTQALVAAGSVQTTAITAAAGGVSVFNTTATTVSMGGAAYTLNFGASNVSAYFGSNTGNISAGNVTAATTITAARFQTTGAYGNITGANVIAANTISATNFVYSANGVSILSGISGTYSNTNVAAYLTTQTFYSNSNVAAYLVANPQGSTYSNANVIANLQNLTTNVVTSANVTAAYFVGNGSALSGLTYNNVGNIYGTSSNVTLQAGSYNWTFDNTGNLVIPTTSNIVYANGTVFTSGTGSSGTNYSNTNVVAMFAANNYIAFGNVVTTYPTLANVTTIFVGNNTTIATGSGPAASATHILNNAYFGPNGAMYARSTYANGIGQFYIDGGNFYWNAQSSSTANAVAGLGGRMSLTSAALSTINSIGITSAGTLTVSGASGLVTTQTTGALFNTTATTINLGGAATALNMGAVNGITTFNANTGGVVYLGTVSSPNGNLNVRAQGVYNTLTISGANGGYNSPPYTNQSLTGGSGTGMTASYSSTGGYVTQSSLVVTNPGTGYKNGDVLTLPGGLSQQVILSNYNAFATGTAIANYWFGIDGNLVLPGNIIHASNTAIYGDFTNSTVNSRTIFLPTAGNANPGIYAAPSGTGSSASWQAANSRDLTNTSKILIASNGTTDVQLVSGINGTGTYLPLSFLTNGSTQMQLGTAGNLNMVTGGNIATTGNVNAGNINATQYGNSIGTTATYSGNITAANINATQYGNSIGTTATYTGNITAGNAIVTNVFGTTPNVTIQAGAYTTLFDNTGNITVSGIGITMPSRPAFRIYGGTPSWFNTANTNLKGSSIVVDYNQGNYFNSTSGVFTAPVAGLYQVTFNARVGSNNSQNQVIVGKNGQSTAGNVAVAWESDTNTGTAIHYGVTSVVRLAVSDWLSANITVGNIQFDQNDSWTVTYIG